jgi:hypothetical protein
MPHPPRSIAQAIEQENIAYQKCAVAGCSRYRYAVARYCRIHRQRRKRHGDPRVSHSILRGHYKTELAEVRNFLKLHRDHAGVQAGLLWIDGFLHSTPDDFQDTLARQLTRLRRYEIQPQKILEECAALWLFLQRRPFMVQSDSIQARSYAFGCAILRLAPQDKRPSYRSASGISRDRPTSQVRGVIGEAVLTVLIPLLNRIAHAIMERRGEGPYQQVLRTPFPSTPDSQ